MLSDPHFYGIKKKTQRLILEHIIIPVSEFSGSALRGLLNVWLEASSDEVRAGSGNLIDFPGLQFK